VRIFGIDPGSERTGYGCVETDGRRHHLISCGAITALPAEPFPQRLARIHRELAALLAAHTPDCVAVETVFHAANVRSALKLGHARGVAILAAVEAGCPVVEYTPAEIKRAVVGYGRAEKHQVQRMIMLLLGLQKAPTTFDASDAVAVAICHLHSRPAVDLVAASREPRAGETGSEVRLKPDSTRGVAAPAAAIPRTGSRIPKTWRQYRPPSTG
jgi:crossover junction endodeoxyribonuclease RuvC